MQVRLEVAHSKANVKRVVLRHDAVIGRSAECSLRIASSLVSRQHCQLTLKEGAVFVRDLRSSNGTFLNGTPLKAFEDVLIPPGSELSVGGVRFYVRYDGAKPMTGPGSTVDLPGTKGPPADSSTTAEWKVHDVAGSSAAESAAEAEGEDLAEAASAMAPAAELAAAQSFAEPAVDEEPVDEASGYAASNDDDPDDDDAEDEEPAPFEPALPMMPMRVAMPFEVPADPMATPSVVPANVPAAAPDEEVIAAKGDEIDTLMIESEGPSEQETIDAGSFRFDDAESESFAGEAAAETDDEDAPSSDDRTEKKGLRSLFSLFGRRKVPQIEQTQEAEAPPAAIRPSVTGAASPIVPFPFFGDLEQPAAPDDTVAEDATADLPAGTAEENASPPDALPIADDDDAIELLEAVEESEPVDLPLDDPEQTLPDLPEGPEHAHVDAAHAPSGRKDEKADDDFGDFLKQIGQD